MARSLRRMSELIPDEGDTTALDKADELMKRMESTQRKNEETEPEPKESSEWTMDRLTISLLSAERSALEKRMAYFREKGYRSFKTSRLARIAINMLVNAPDEEILRHAVEVPNLEKHKTSSRER